MIFLSLQYVLFHLSAIIGFRVSKNAVFNRDLKTRAITIDKFSPTSIQSCNFDGTSCVLLAKSDERDQNMMKSAILICEHHNKSTVGLILDRSSGYTMGDLSQNAGILSQNKLFLAGNGGMEDTVVMVHRYMLGGYSKSIGCGLHVGGMREAKILVDNFEAHPNDFKFFHKNVRWAPGLLNTEIRQGRWDVCKVPANMIICQDIKTKVWDAARSALGIG